MSGLLLYVIFIAGVALGAICQCGAAARYRRMWREALKLIEAMDEQRETIKAFKLDPSTYRTLHRELRQARARHTAERYRRPPGGWR